MTRVIIASLFLLPITLVAASDLRDLYSVPQSQWPAAFTSDGRRPSPMAPLKSVSVNSSLARLGERLFHDVQLSRDKTVSCSSCHESRLAFQDSRPRAIGIESQQGTRNTQPIFGIDLWQSFFWDGRATTANQQALMPIANPLEMDLDPKTAIARINSDPSYTHDIQAVFNRTSISTAELASALVEFQRTLLPPPSRYLEFIAAVKDSPLNASKLLSDKELKGLHLFRTKAMCMTCHDGPLLSDNKFHGTGLHYYGRRFEDRGRYNHTGDPKDMGKFRTPSLLALSNTAPWMHNGLFNDLRGIISMYNHGGVRPRPRDQQLHDPLFPKTSDLLKPLNLTKEEVDELLAFLQIL